MKNFLKILIIGSLIYSCGSLSKRISKNSFVVQKRGIMDTLTVFVTGKITDLYDKSEIRNGNIKLTNSLNSYSTNCKENGKFSFEHISSGSYKVRGSFVGYHKLRGSIELKSGEIVKLKIELEPVK